MIEGPSGNLIATLVATRNTDLRGLVDFIQDSPDLPFLETAQTYEVVVELKGEDKENLTEKVLLSRF